VLKLLVNANIKNDNVMVLLANALVPLHPFPGIHSLREQHTADVTNIHPSPTAHPYDNWPIQLLSTTVNCFPSTNEQHLLLLEQHLPLPVFKTTTIFPTL
jgi:hypothetical protein